MARVPYLDDHSNPEVKPVAARIRAERGGRVLNLYRVLLNSPKLAEAWLQFFTVIRQQCELPAQYREAAILIIAVINGAAYEYRPHLPRGRDSSLFDATQRAVLDYAESMTRDVHVPDAVFEAVAQHFDPRQTV